ncbi:MAG: hypothetical protein AB7O98_08510 [Hyphomonadaceae bacterium]
MRALLAVTALLALAGCVFWSEGALFDESTAVTPFEDGEHFVWIDDAGEQTKPVIYQRSGSGYVLNTGVADENPISVHFFDVPETPEPDLIAQIELPNADSSRAYAFMWPVNEGYRIVTAPGALADVSGSEAALEAACADRRNGECRFATADDVRRFYASVIHPKFVTGGLAPDDFLDQMPLQTESP